MAVHIIHVYREQSDRGMLPHVNFPFVFREPIDPITWEPNVDIYETDDEVIIRAELAGVTREEVSVSVNLGNLVISGERRVPDFKAGTRFHQAEIKCGSFLKIISLPPSLEHNEIEAHLQDGLLEIRISKRQEVVEIPIEIRYDSETK